MKMWPSLSKLLDEKFLFVFGLKTEINTTSEKPIKSSEVSFCIGPKLQRC
jgi:hypothetical protein